MLSVLVASLDRTLSLSFASDESVAVKLIKKQIEDKDGLPCSEIRLTCNGKILTDEYIFSSEELQNLPVLRIYLRLNGGKGGFGSLLRGGNARVGQKKTTNFDACRDLNGRRIRHTNNERRLAEWYSQEKEREMERIAQEHINKLATEQKKHVFDETVYNTQLENIEESITASIDEGLKEASISVSIEEKKVAEKKKKTRHWDSLFLGKRKRKKDEKEEDEDEEEEDEDEVSEEEKEREKKKSKKEPTITSTTEKVKKDKGKEKVTEESTTTTTTTTQNKIKPKETRNNTTNNNNNKKAHILPPPPDWIAC